MSPSPQMLRSIKIKMIAVTLIVLISAGAWSTLYIKRVANAYVFGYPLVIMDLTRALMEDSWKDAPRANNSFHHLQSFPDHNFKNVVRPNNDTLYSIAWLDLSDGPLIMSVPDTDDRYYVMPLMDAWTNVFASVGKRTHGTGASGYMIVGPQWQGDSSKDMEVIQSPTNMVWVIGRIQTNSKADIAAVAQLQSGFTLAPFSDLPKPHTETEAQNTATNLQKDSSKVDLNKYLADMPASDFFTRLSELMILQPSSSEDSEAIENLNSIGITADKTFAGPPSPLHNWIMNHAIAITLDRIHNQLNSDDRLENGWKVQRDSIGNYGTNYAVRAAVAIIGLGALPPAEAAYPNTEVDSQLQPLHGSNRYRLHFNAGELPPVNAFWSLSMYNDEGFFIANPINRYVIGDRDELNFNADGSLDILIQTDLPQDSNENWLPAPTGKFALTMRLYSPKPSFTDGQWKLPKVEKIPIENN